MRLPLLPVNPAVDLWINSNSAVSALAAGDVKFFQKEQAMPGLEGRHSVEGFCI